MYIVTVTDERQSSGVMMGWEWRKFTREVLVAANGPTDAIAAVIEAGLYERITSITARNATLLTEMVEERRLDAEYAAANP